MLSVCANLDPTPGGGQEEPWGRRVSGPGEGGAGAEPAGRRGGARSGGAWRLGPGGGGSAEKESSGRNKGVRGRGAGEGNRFFLRISSPPSPRLTLCPLKSVRTCAHPRAQGEPPGGRQRGVTLLPGSRQVTCV